MGTVVEQRTTGLQRELEEIGRRERALLPENLARYDVVLGLARESLGFPEVTDLVTLCQEATRLIQAAIDEVDDPVDRRIAQAAMGATTEFAGLSVTDRKSALSTLYGISPDLYKRRRQRIFLRLTMALSTMSTDVVAPSGRVRAWPVVALGPISDLLFLSTRLHSLLMFANDGIERARAGAIIDSLCAEMLLRLGRLLSVATDAGDELDYVSRSVGSMTNRLMLSPIHVSAIRYAAGSVDMRILEREVLIPGTEFKDSLSLLLETTHGRDAITRAREELMNASTSSMSAVLDEASLPLKFADDLTDLAQRLLAEIEPRPVMPIYDVEALIEYMSTLPYVREWSLNLDELRILVYHTSHSWMKDYQARKTAIRDGRAWARRRPKVSVRRILQARDNSDRKVRDSRDRD